MRSTFGQMDKTPLQGRDPHSTKKESRAETNSFVPHVHEMGRVVISDRDHKNMQDSYAKIMKPVRLYAVSYAASWARSSAVSYMECWSEAECGAWFA